MSNAIVGSYVRSFEVTINNNAERFYTLNRQLFAQAIAPKKRDVSGTIVLMGRNQNIAALANTNQARCSESTEINFGFVPLVSGGSSCGTGFNTILPNCIFEIETMSLSNELFETTINYYSLPGAGNGIGDPLISNIGQASFTEPSSFPV